MNHARRKKDICLCKNKGADQLRSNCEVQFLLYLYLKFQDSNFLLRRHRQVCVRPGRKNCRPVFSRLGSNNSSYSNHTDLLMETLTYFFLISAAHSDALSLGVGGAGLGSAETRLVWLSLRAGRSGVVPLSSGEPTWDVIM